MAIINAIVDCSTSNSDLWFKMAKKSTKYSIIKAGEISKISSEINLLKILQLMQDE